MRLGEKWWEIKIIYFVLFIIPKLSIKVQKKKKNHSVSLFYIICFLIRINTYDNFFPFIYLHIITNRPLDNGNSKIFLLVVTFKDIEKLLLKIFTSISIHHQLRQITSLIKIDWNINVLVFSIHLILIGEISL